MSAALAATDMVLAREQKLHALDGLAAAAAHELGTPLSKPTELDEIGAPVEVRRHAGARRLMLRVSRTRRAVIVTLPLQCDLNEADSFIIRNID
ncbi:unnamed protein product, partial [marine sediment metagenome]